VASKNWVYRREASELLQCAYKKLPEIAEAHNIRHIAIPGQYTKYHKGDVLDLAASFTRGRGRVGTIANGRQGTGDDPGQILADETGAVSATRPTEAGCSLQ
jgi:hypothetical protein